MDSDRLQVARSDLRGLGGARVRCVLAHPSNHGRDRRIQHSAPNAPGYEKGLAGAVSRRAGRGQGRPASVLPPFGRADVHRALPRARAHRPGDRRLQLPGRAEADRDHHSGDGQARLGERRQAQGEVREPSSRLLSHQRPARTGDRHRQVRRYELGRQVDGAGAHRRRLRPQQGPDHRPRFRLPSPSPVLRVDQLAPRARALARLCDLAAGAPFPQQHLAGADGGAHHVGQHIAVADVSPLATSSAGGVLELHVQPGLRA